MTELDQALTLSPDSPGRFGAVLDRGWSIGFAVNGGLVLAVLGQALRRTLGPSGHPDPLAISAYYLSATAPGPATVTTEVVREGRTMATGQAALWQSDAGGSVMERVRALATYGDLGSLNDEVRTTPEPPSMPAPEACVGADMAPPGSVGDLPFLHRFDLRLDPETVGWALGSPSHRGVIQGWLRVRVSTRNLAGGLHEEDAEVWDSRDGLVAQSRQLARAPRG